MLHILSRIFSEFLSPFLWIIILIVISLFLKKPKWKKRLQIAAFVILIVFSNPLLYRLCLSAWEKGLFPASSMAGKADIAVVMGGMASFQESTGRIRFNGSADRLFQALELYKKGYVKKIVISGGNPLLLRKERPESAFLKSYLLLIGITESDVFTEERSRDTRENASYTAQLFRENGWEKRIVLVTSAFHSRRARFAFEREGFQVTPYDADPTKSIRPVNLKEVLVPDPGKFGNWQLLIKEWVGLAVYKIIG
jgi:uncharacterized SAM-binding protein YcdF (DUF218 family)